MDSEYERFLMMHSTTIAQMVCSAVERGWQSSRHKMSLNSISSITTVPNSIFFHRNVPHNAFYQNVSECLAQLNNMATRAKIRNTF